MVNQLDFWPEDVGPDDRLTWSVSRDKRLRACLRRYYLHHFASRGGHLPGGDPQARELYVLKHLRNRYMWVGEIVHEMIELALSAFRRGESVPVDQLVERGTRRMRAQYAESLQGVYRDRPHQACGLFEHEYREDVSRDEWRTQRDRMEQCLRAFFGLPIVETLRQTPSWRWLAVESAASFELEGATVLVKPDFAFRDEQDRVVIVDWKTGKPRLDDERLQLATYGVYARRAWGIGPDYLRACVAYLETGEVMEQHLTHDDLAWAETAIRDSVRQMRELGASELLAERFPQTDDVSRCALCCFRRACGRDPDPHNSSPNPSRT